MCLNLNNCCTPGLCKCSSTKAPPQLPNPILDTGRSYKLRNGMKGVITGRTPDPLYSWCGYYNTNMGHNTCEALLWTKEGTYHNQKQSDWDILEEWKEPLKVERWLVYHHAICAPTVEVSTCSSYMNALETARTWRQHHSHTVYPIEKVVYEVGKGLTVLP